MERGRLRALIRCEVDVARGAREAVRFAHGGAADDLDGEVHVHRHAPQHGELLRILLAEVGTVRLHHQEEPGDDRGDALEVAGAALALQHLGQAPDAHAGRVAVRVDLLDGRNERDVRARVTEQIEVAVLVAGVVLEVLVRAKLRGVHEDRDDDSRALRLGRLDQ